MCVPGVCVCLSNACHATLLCLLKGSLFYFFSPPACLLCVSSGILRSHSSLVSAESCRGCPRGSPQCCIIKTSPFAGGPMVCDMVTSLWLSVGRCQAWSSQICSFLPLVVQETPNKEENIWTDIISKDKLKFNIKSCFNQNVKNVLFRVKIHLFCRICSPPVPHQTLFLSFSPFQPFPAHPGRLTCLCGGRLTVERISA